MSTPVPNVLLDTTRQRVARVGPRRRAARLAAVGIGLVALGVLAGCGSSPAPAAPATVVVTQTAAPETQTVTATVEPTTSEAVAPTPTATPKAASKAVSKPAGKITVPDGVGMNYQKAQDLWRSAGLHVSMAVDATGANRIPVLDRNWVVLAQDLEPGSKVAADSFITATIKKYSDN